MAYTLDIVDETFLLQEFAGEHFMAKKRNLFEELREGLEEIRDKPESLRRYVFTPPDVSKVRKDFGMTQSQMALFLNVSARTLQNWEQGRREPTGAARTLLRVMQKEPKAVKRALHS
ncbi:MAG: helix-turn-helix domain-containing protein [Proteobacteria bacterium]|nr:helix-turn-helix domain-containing protein [Pseudomonadota bacterium]